MLKIIILCFSLGIVNIVVAADEWAHLFDRAIYQEVKISPDGKHLAVAVMSEGKRKLLFLDRTSLKLVGLSEFPGKNEAGDYYWVNNERVVIKINQRHVWVKQPRFYGELFAVNWDGSKASIVYGYRAAEMQTGSKIRKKKQVLGWANIVDILPNDDKHILISSTPWDKEGDKLATLYKLNIYNGVLKKKVAKSPISYANFVTDKNGKVRVATGIDENNHRQVFLRNDDQWSKLPEANYGSNFWPLTVNTKGNELYVLDNYQQDLRGLFKLNLTDGTYKHIFTHEKIDITAIERTTDRRGIYAIRVDDGFPEYYLINKKTDEAKVFNNLLSTFPEHTINITSHSDNGHLYLVRVKSEIDPGSYYLYDKENNKLRFLFKYFPKVNSKQLARIEPFEFNASDGKLINGYFTKAKLSSDSEIAPLVILVHGGPQSRDYWQYNSQVQYLALNGFSVLQVNFRGSSGYGMEHKEAAYKAWGSLVQQDIFEAYQWAITNKKVKPNNACIMGASFGGYSSIQSIINYPQAYQCAVANAGIYDLELMFNEGDIPERSFGISYLEMALGTETKILREMSPIFHTDKIQVPIFLAHGEQDERAPFEHAKRLRTALDNSNKSYKWFSLPKETHGFHDPENQKAYMKQVVDFLKQNLM